MKALVLRILFLFLPLTAYSQSFNISLSPVHQKKISGIESGHKRMKKYYKFYKKDSSQHFKRLNRKQKKDWDSTMRAARKDERLRRKLGDRYPMVVNNQVDSINKQMKAYRSTLNDTTQSDSVRAEAKEKLKELAVTRLKMDPTYAAIESQYGEMPDSLTWKYLSQRVPLADSLSGLFNDPKDLISFSASLIERQLLNRADLSSMAGANAKMLQLKGMTSSFRGKYNPEHSKDSLKQVGKDKLAEKALDYFAQNPGKLEAASQKASRLFSKYRSFTSSTDLKDATRQTSMEGTTFFQKFVFGGTFNVVSTKPISVDLSPQLGYRFSTKFFVGVGMRYRATFSDSLKYSWYVSPKNTAAKLFASYDIYKSWYTYVEGELTGQSRPAATQEEKNKWYPNYFIGGGRRFLIHPKVYMTLSALYNLNGQSENPLPSSEIPGEGWLSVE